MTKKRKPEVRRDLHFAGYDFTSGPSGTVIHRDRVPASAPGEDYGADPLGDGTFRMVPSGDVVDFEERNRRLARFNKKLSSNPSTDEANTRWLIAKYGLTRAEAKKVISTGDVNGVVRAHETWMKEHGYPPHNSPAARERLLYLAQFSTDWRKGLDWPDFASNPRARKYSRTGKGRMRANPRAKQELSHRIQFRVPGGMWVWATNRGTGTMNPDEAKVFPSREDAEDAAKRIQGPHSSLQAKVVSMPIKHAPARANPLDGSTAIVGVLIGAALAGVAWLVLRPSTAEASAPGPSPTPSPAPSGKQCTSFETLEKFATAKGYKLYYATTATGENPPVSKWPPPKPEYVLNPLARSYSPADCGFYKWTGIAWVPDTALDAELSAWIKSSTEAATSAPAAPISTIPATPLSTPTSSPVPFSPAAPAAPASLPASSAQAAPFAPTSGAKVQWL